MFSSHSYRSWVLAIAIGSQVEQGLAQPVAPESPPSLAAALDAAWRLGIAHATITAKRDDIAARQQALNAPLAGPVVATFAHRTDRLGANQGLSEWEAELSAPLWNNTLRQALRTDVAADARSAQAQLNASRLKLAGELRQLMSEHASALDESAAAKTRSSDAKAVQTDVNRRVSAGEAPRIDALGAQAATAAADLAVLQAQGQAQRIAAQWQALTGLATVASLPDHAPSTPATPLKTDLSNHPVIEAALANTQAAQAKLDATLADRNDPMAVSVGLTRERAGFGATPASQLRVALSLPLASVLGRTGLGTGLFGNAARNAPKAAAARLALAQAEAEAHASERQIRAELAGLDQALPVAQQVLALTRARAAATNESLALVAKAYALGEADWATRQRAQLERDESIFAVTKAQSDLRRLHSQLTQALGELP